MIAPKVLIMMIVPVLATIVCAIVPRWISFVIVVFDAIWVSWLIGVFTWWNPEGVMWLRDPSTILFTFISALPILFELIRTIIKYPKKQ
jgi:hypothetical protein